MCNRLIVATMPLDFALLGLIPVSLWVQFSELGELAIAQAVCQTVVVRKGLVFPVACLARQDEQSEKARRKRRNFRLKGRIRLRKECVETY